ncbi:hypothetical protein [Vibrio phage BONAISHI]|nr:hypothetical protein [Vibrio phage BONAISHI]
MSRKFNVRLFHKDKPKGKQWGPVLKFSDLAELDAILKPSKPLGYPNCPIRYRYGKNHVEAYVAEGPKERIIAAVDANAALTGLKIEGRRPDDY